MTGFLRSSLFLSSALSLLAYASGSQAADSKLVWSSMGSTNNPIVNCGPRKIAEKIRSITGHGEESHLGGSAFANPRKQYSQLVRGITGFSWGVLSYTPGRFPLNEILTLPFVARNNKAAAHAISVVHGKYPELQKETSDIHLLAVAAAGPYQLHLKKPITSVADLKGLRLRTSGKPLGESAKALGADVVGMPLPHAYENLQKGVIDGYFGTNTSLVAFKLNEVTTYHVEMNIISPLLFAGVSKKYFDGLNRSQQEQIDAALGGPAAAVRYSSCFDKPDSVGIGLAKKRGSTIRKMSADEEAAIRKKVQPVTDGYLAGLEKKGLPGRAIYNDIVTEIANYK